MFSAAMPPASAATVLACLELLEKKPERLERLRKNVAYITRGFEEIGLSFIPSETPIVSVFIGDEGQAFHLVKDLFENGVFATPVVYPAVPFGQAIIRTSYMATHTKKELDFVLEVFKKLSPKYGILKSKMEIPRELINKTETYNFKTLTSTVS